MAGIKNFLKQREFRRKQKEKLEIDGRDQFTNTLTQFDSECDKPPSHAAH